MAEEAEEEEGGGGLPEETICEEGAPEWVVTFGDMMSLLLTFFILLLSFATMDVMRFKQLAGTIKQGFGLKVKEQLIVVPKAADMVRRQTRIDFNAKKVMEELKRKLDPHSRTKRTAQVTIEVFQSYRGVVALFPADEFFVPGTDRLKPEARPLLAIVAEQYRDINERKGDPENPDSRFELLVEVRSPEGAPRAPRFADTWSLTAAQAVAVSRALRTQGLPDGDVVAVGRGPAPSTPKPGTVGAPPSGSTVEFVFLSRPLKPRN